MIVHFITGDYLKTSCDLDFNIDSSKLVNSITKAQDTYLMDRLGSYFMQHLSDAVENNTLTVDEKALIDNYIMRYVAEWAYWLLIPKINFKATNKAVSKQSSEWSQPSELNEVKYIRDDVRNMAEYYGVRLDNYLCDNYQKFPKWNNPLTPENKQKGSRNYFSGVYLQKGGGEWDKYHKKYL